MRFLLSLCLLLNFAACSHKKMCADKSSCAKTESCSKTVKPALAYDGHCPMGLTNKAKVKGDHQYKLEYKGKHYVFSSTEARDSFMSKIDDHIKKADAQWESLEAVDRIK